MKRAPKILYLHGFASSPQSNKAKKFVANAKSRFDVDVTALDLRVPSFSHLRLSEMMRVTRAAIGDANDRAILVGSSLGGLTAARVAEADARVGGLVLLAPAFQLAARWRARLGDADFHAWEESGWLEVDDHATGKKSRVDFGFIEELTRIDVELPDVRVPTFIVHGKNDDVVPPEASRAFAENKSWVKRIEVDDGHELGNTISLFFPQIDAFLEPWLGAAKTLA